MCEQEGEFPFGFWYDGGEVGGQFLVRGGRSPRTGHHLTVWDGEPWRLGSDKLPSLLDSWQVLQPAELHSPL